MKKKPIQTLENEFFFVGKKNILIIINTTKKNPPLIFCQYAFVFVRATLGNSRKKNFFSDFFKESLKIRKNTTTKNHHIIWLIQR